MTNSLERGCDCLGEIRYFDVQLADGRGEPYPITNAICLHEEDHGILWKHVDADLGHTEMRRSRRLVVSFIITAGNYEYAFYWYFYQDAPIELEIKLTGIVLTAALPPGETSDYGTVVAPQTLAAHHQHFFSVRWTWRLMVSATPCSRSKPRRCLRGPVTPMAMRSGRAARCCGQNHRHNG